jgi:hypothetical protein
MYEESPRLWEELDKIDPIREIEDEIKLCDGPNNDEHALFLTVLLLVHLAGKNHTSRNDMPLATACYCDSLLILYRARKLTT